MKKIHLTVRSEKGRPERPNMRTLVRTIGTVAILVSPAAGLRGEDIFGAPGRLISEGRIFSAACHDLNGDGRLEIAVSDYLNPARVLYDDGRLGFQRSVPLTSNPETARQVIPEETTGVDG